MCRSGYRRRLRKNDAVLTFDDAGRITSMRAFWDASEMAPLDEE